MTSHRLVQAYRQAPWRRQIQWIVFVLIVVVGAALVALVYLNISSQTATAGLEIQNMQSSIDELQQQIADQNSKLAWLTSATLMKARAQSMGFEMAMPQNELYIIVPGYQGRSTAVIAPSNISSLPQSLIRSSYTQSLWEWMFQGIFNINANQAGQ
jgi:type IV secretory pathway VirB2 component (pilin)